MEKTVTHALAAAAAVLIVLATWAPVITVPQAGPAAVAVAAPALA